ncbi:NmrA family NAD(P)-binding protein [Streptomyces bacillaris]|uniref:NmrA family NAD(P)-binding protein n=1 Tax=Streptomyces bacillaris TaxID=68179 RepID=UPI00380DFD3E
MAVLVAGATGNVGRHVVGRLVEAGQDVRALTRRPGAAALPPRGPRLRRRPHPP